MQELREFKDVWGGLIASWLLFGWAACLILIAVYAILVTQEVPKKELKAFFKYGTIPLLAGVFLFDTASGRHPLYRPMKNVLGDTFTLAFGTIEDVEQLVKNNPDFHLEGHILESSRTNYGYQTMGQLKKALKSGEEFDRWLQVHHIVNHHMPEFSMFGITISKSTGEDVLKKFPGISFERKLSQINLEESISNHAMLKTINEDPNAIEVLPESIYPEIKCMVFVLSDEGIVNELIINPEVVKEYTCPLPEYSPEYRYKTVIYSKDINPSFRYLPRYLNEMKYFQAVESKFPRGVSRNAIYGKNFRSFIITDMSELHRRNEKRRKMKREQEKANEELYSIPS